MDWSSLGSLFCLELALGAFVFLALLAKAPLSPFFFRMNGGMALLLLLVAWWIRFLRATPESVAARIVFNSSESSGSSFPAGALSLRPELIIDYNAATVPEPGTLLLLSSGLAACGIRALRRRRAEGATTHAATSTSTTN